MNLVSALGLPRVTMVVGESTDWSRDWSPALGPDELITSSVWTLPTGITPGPGSQSGPYTTQWVETTETGDFILTNAIQTSELRKLVRSMVISVVEVM